MFVVSREEHLLPPLRLARLVVLVAPIDQLSFSSLFYPKTLLYPRSLSILKIFFLLASHSLNLVSPPI